MFTKKELEFILIGMKEDCHREEACRIVNDGFGECNMTDAGFKELVALIKKMQDLINTMVGE